MPGALQRRLQVIRQVTRLGRANLFVDAAVLGIIVIGNAVGEFDDTDIE